MPIKDPDKRKAAQRKADAKRKGKRTRNWACLLYPESANERWQAILSEMSVKCFVSPLHDKDVWSDYDEADNPEHKAGSPKKAHYHVQFLFSAVKTKEQVEEIAEKLGATNCIQIEDAQAYARYLCHLGCKDKHEYSTDDVLQFGGINYQEFIQSTMDVVKAIAEMEVWCEEQGVTSYARLSAYVRSERPDLYRILVFNGRHLKDVLKAMEWEAKKEAEEDRSSLMEALTLGREATR
jgi:hypothetical protein